MSSAWAGWKKVLTVVEVGVWAGVLAESVRSGEAPRAVVNRALREFLERERLRRARGEGVRAREGELF